MRDKKISGNNVNSSASSNSPKIYRNQNINPFEDPNRQERCLQYKNGKKLIHLKLADKYKLEILKSVVEIEGVARYMLEIINGVESYVREKNVSHQEIFKQDMMIKNYLSKLNQNISFIKNIINKYNISSKDNEIENGLFRLSYIERYLAMNLRFNYIIPEHSEFLSEHLSRVKYYISEQISSYKQVCEGLMIEIISRVPGGGNDNLLLDRDKYTY